MKYTKRKTMNKTIQGYKDTLPEKITLTISKSEDGLWAKVKELPHCYTQAKNYPELILMINDAIYTYLKIPMRHKKLLGFYLPTEFVDEFTRRKWEQLFKELAAHEVKKESRLELVTK